MIKKTYKVKIILNTNKFYKFFYAKKIILYLQLTNYNKCDILLE